jgi:hypothetical protein
MFLSIYSSGDENCSLLPNIIHGVNYKRVYHEMFLLVYSSGNANHSPSPYHYSWCQLHTGLPTKRYIPVVMRMFPLLSINIQWSVMFLFTNKITDGMGTPTLWRLMFFFIGVHFPWQNHWRNRYSKTMIINALFYCWFVTLLPTWFHRWKHRWKI